MLNTRCRGDLRWGLGLLVSFSGCQEVVGVERPAGAAEGLVLLEGEAGLYAYAWALGDGDGPNPFALPELEVRLWLEYPSGSLLQFLEPGARLFPSIAKDQGTLQGPPRRLPRPERVHRWSSPGGWQERPIDTRRPEPEVEDFRLPPLDPFECAGLGGCFPLDEPLDPSGAPSCSPCPSPPAPQGPAAPRPPVLEPCPAGWSLGVVAGVAACLPPDPCDPGADPKTGTCALLEPCPGLTVDDRAAELVVDPGRCGVPGRSCTLAEALEALSPGANTATIALSAGDHHLPSGAPPRPVHLVGLCPAATRLHAEALAAPPVVGPWEFSDLELRSNTDLGPSALTLNRVVIGALPRRLRAARIELRDSLIFNGSTEFDAGELHLDVVRIADSSLRLKGPARLQRVALTNSAVVTTDELEVKSSLLGLTATSSVCESIEPGTAWRLEDVAITLAPPLLLNFGRCDLEARRVSLRSLGAGLNGNVDVHGAGDLLLEDVVVELQGEAGNFAQFVGETTVRRLRLFGATDQVFDLNRGRGADLADLDLESTSTQLSTARSPEVISLRAARPNRVERLRAVGFPSLGIAIKNDVRDLPAVRGQTELLDVEIRRCRQGGILAVATDLSANRLQVQDSFGAGVGLQFGAAAQLNDLQIKGTKPLEDQCRLVSPGPPCQGTGLYAILESQVVAERFALEAAYGVAIDSAAAILREGNIEADIAFQIGRTPSDPRDLLRGVKLDAPQIIERQ